MRRITHAWLNIQRNRRRSAMSVLIIAIAAMALISSGGFGLYTYQSLAEASARQAGHLSLTQPGYFDIEADFPLQNGIANAETIRRALLGIEQVKAVQPRIAFSGLASNSDKSSIFLGEGVLPSEFTHKGPFLTLQAGQLLTETTASAAPQILLGTALAANLKMQVGDWVTLLSTTAQGALNAVDFQVQGLVSTGIPDRDKRLVYIHLTQAQQLLASDKVSVIAVFRYSDAELAPLFEQVAQLTPELEITPWWKRAFFYEGVKNLYNRIFSVLGLVMGLVVFVALFNTLSMSITERTREIGTLAAMGTSSSELLSGFVIEAVLLALLGLAIGIALSGSISLLLTVFDLQMPPPPGRDVGYPLQITFDLTLVGWVSLAIVLVCASASAIAARQGIKKPITEALIYV